MNYVHDKLRIHYNVSHFGTYTVGHYYYISLSTVGRYAFTPLKKLSGSLITQTPLSGTHTRMERKYERVCVHSYVYVWVSEWVSKCDTPDLIYQIRTTQFPAVKYIFIVGVILATTSPSNHFFPHSRPRATYWYSLTVVVRVYVRTGIGTIWKTHPCQQCAITLYVFVEWMVLYYSSPFQSGYFENCRSTKGHEWNEWMYVQCNFVVGYVPPIRLI